MIIICYHSYYFIVIFLLLVKTEIDFRIRCKKIVYGMG